MRIQERGQSIRRDNGIDNKRPFIIGIGGSHSGAGKTTVAEALLKKLTEAVTESPHSGGFVEAKRGQSSNYPVTRHSSLVARDGWGAIKYTKTAIYASIIDDPETLTQESKDTARLISAGAEKVLWV
ncbi:MAG: hypothetical protein Q7J70_05200, partial [Thermodesulfovibrionales bacterium]|nr:hypothetical protein [Thermodesulfovibrionales bacterium]